MTKSYWNTTFALKIFLFVFVIALTPACRSKKEGCPTKDFTTSMDTKKKGKSNLFSKKMRKKMK